HGVNGESVLRHIRQARKGAKRSQAAEQACGCKMDGRSAAEGAPKDNDPVRWHMASINEVVACSIGRVVDTGVADGSRTHAVSEVIGTEHVEALKAEPLNGSH